MLNPQANLGLSNFFIASAAEFIINITNPEERQSDKEQDIL